MKIVLLSGCTSSGNVVSKTRTCASAGSDSKARVGHVDLWNHDARQRARDYAAAR